jgi:hypothetical protein
VKKPKAGPNTTTGCWRDTTIRDPSTNLCAMH